MRKDLSHRSCKGVCERHAEWSYMVMVSDRRGGICKIKRENQCKILQNVSQRTAWGFKSSNFPFSVRKSGTDTHISAFTFAIKQIGCVALQEFCRTGPGQPAVTDRIGPNADGLIWLALSVQRPVYHHKSQTSNPYQNQYQYWKCRLKTVVTMTPEWNFTFAAF